MSINNYDRKNYNRTLKIIGNSYDKEMWKIYKEHDRSDRCVFGNLIGYPTVSNLEKWFKFWKNKNMDFNDIDIQVFNMIIGKTYDK